MPPSPSKTLRIAGAGGITDFPAFQGKQLQRADDAQSFTLCNIQAERLTAVAKADMAVSKSIVCWLSISLTIYLLRRVAASEDVEEESGEWS